MDWTLLPVLLAVGVAVGFIAGLLGVGGGMTLVPLLTMLFAHEHFPSGHIVHMALGTSTATIVFTAMSSVRAHHRHGAVRWSIVAAMAPGIVVGSLAGPQFASILPSRALAAIFGVFTWTSATRMLLAKTPEGSGELPGRIALFGVGGGIGVVSSILGAGGGFMSIPFLARRSVKLHSAVATSAALGLPIAVAGSAGFVIAGLRQSGLPPWSAGYVYLPAMVAVVITSMLVAPIGASMAHRWPAARLSRSFAALLYTLGAYMLWEALRG